MTNPVLKSRLLQVLDDPAISRINFVIGGFAFRPQLYRRVRDRIASDAIEVRGAAGSRWAEYDSAENVFTAGSSCIRNDTQRAHIVHEATHALCDVCRYQGMERAVSESAAYIAQCIFMRVKTPGTQLRLLGSTRALDTVFEQAWACAGTLLQRGYISHADAMELRKRVVATPNYRNNVTCVYDGVD